MTLKEFKNRLNGLKIGDIPVKAVLNNNSTPRSVYGIFMDGWDFSDSSCDFWVLDCYCINPTNKPLSFFKLKEKLETIKYNNGLAIECCFDDPDETSQTWEYYPYGDDSPCTAYTGCDSEQIKDISVDDNDGEPFVKIIC